MMKKRMKYSLFIIFFNCILIFIRFALDFYEKRLHEDYVIDFVDMIAMAIQLLRGNFYENENFNINKFENN